jgi:prepilin-type N-terminal cleavage/methylation domain-containing protein
MLLASRARGFSLPEILLTVVLLAMLVTLGARILHWVTHSVRWLYQRSSLQQQSMVIMDRCESDLRQCCRDGLSLAPPNLVGMNRLDPCVYPGLCTYEDQEVVYRLAGPSLYRELFPHPRADWKTSEPNLLLPLELTQLVLTPPLQRIRMTDSAHSFAITPDPDPVFRVDLELQALVPGRPQPLRCNAQRWFTLRNKK